MAKRNGYIYVVKINENYKIGKTNNPKQRLGEYTRLFQIPEVVLLEYVKDYSKLELELHKMFKSKSLRGEWFQLSQLDLETIERILKYNSTEFSDEEIPNNKIRIDFTSKLSIKIKSKKFTKTMDKEKELVDLLLDSPSTYLAISIMKRYIVTNYNVLVKDGIKYKVQDLANDMKITRQMASYHIRKLKSINVLSELETDRGKLFCINPKYYFRGEDVPKSVLDLFDKGK